MNTQYFVPYMCMGVFLNKVYGCAQTHITYIVYMYMFLVTHRYTYIHTYVYEYSYTI